MHRYLYSTQYIHHRYLLLPFLILSPHHQEIVPKLLAQEALKSGRCSYCCVLVACWLAGILHLHRITSFSFPKSRLLFVTNQISFIFYTSLHIFRRKLLTVCNKCTFEVWPISFINISFITRTPPNPKPLQICRNSLQPNPIQTTTKTFKKPVDIPLISTGNKQ